jgi:phage-related protein
MGGSREDLRDFPETVQDSLGFELYRVQCGFDPKDWKPMTTVGARVIYLASLPEGIYVLHCFQKKTQKTSRSDLELAMKRFKAIAK